MTNDLLNVIPNTKIDDYFIFGFIAGFVGFLYYQYTNKNNPEARVDVAAGFYGVVLSGCLGGLLAIVFDNSIEVSIIVGLLNQFIYMALLKSAKSGDFWNVIKEFLVKILTAGKGP